MLTLDVDAPVILLELEGLQGPLLAEALGLVDELIAAVVSCSRVPLRILVCRRSVDGSRGGQVVESYSA